MQVYLWTNDCPPMGQLNDVNAADDAMIVYHEYTHGMTNRLVTLADGSPGMNGYQAGAMDEGLADWYALDRSTRRASSPTPRRRASCGSAGTRTTSCAPSRSTARLARLRPPVRAVGLLAVGGYTYGDFARILGGAEVHADGEIWVETLWTCATA